MKILVIGAGMMGRAAAYDMARSERVQSVTLADNDEQRLKLAVEEVNKLAGNDKVRAVNVDGADTGAALDVMRGHDGVLSCGTVLLQPGIGESRHTCRMSLRRPGRQQHCRSAGIRARGASTRRGRGDCTRLRYSRRAWHPSLRGELLRRIGGKADALKIYVGGLPQSPKPPFNYQLVFSVEGLINEYCEPAKILRDGKMITIEPLTEVESFHMEGFPELEAFHTSGGTSTLPETFQGQVGECFEKTLRYPGHVSMLRRSTISACSPVRSCRSTACWCRHGRSCPICSRRNSPGDEPEVTLLRVEAHHGDVAASFSMVDYTDATRD